MVVAYSSDIKLSLKRLLHWWLSLDSREYEGMEIAKRNMSEHECGICNSNY